MIPPRSKAYLFQFFHPAYEVLEDFLDLDVEIAARKPQAMEKSLPHLVDAASD